MNRACRMRKGSGHGGRRVDRRGGGGARLQSRHRGCQVRCRGMDRVIGHAVGGDPFARRHLQPGAAADRAQARRPPRRRPPSVRLFEGALFLELHRRHPAVLDGRRRRRSTRASRSSPSRTRLPTRTSTMPCSASLSCSSSSRPGRRFPSSTRAAASRASLAALRTSKDPALFTVVLEDLAALAGLFVALAGIVIAHHLAIPRPTASPRSSSA